MEQLNKIPVFKKDAIIQLKFTPDFYQRLVILLQSVTKDKTQEEFQEAAKQIESKQIKDEWVLNYETLLYIVKGSEEYAQQNDLTEYKDMDEIIKEQTKDESTDESIEDTSKLITE